MTISLELVNGSAFDFLSADGVEFVNGKLYASSQVQLPRESGVPLGADNIDVNIIEIDLATGEQRTIFADADNPLVTVTGVGSLPNGNLLLSSILEPDGEGGLAWGVIEIDTEGNIITDGISFTTPGFGFSDFRAITGIVYDAENGQIIGTDSLTNVLIKADIHGNVIEEIDLTQSVPGIVPQGIVIDPATGNLLISSDSDGNNDIHEFTTDGKLVTSLGTLANFGAFEDPEGLAIDPDTRTLYVSFDNDSLSGIPVTQGNQIAAFQIKDTFFEDMNILSVGQELAFLEGGMPFVATTLSDGTTVGDFPVNDIYVNGYDTGEGVINPVSGGFTPSDTETFTIVGDLAGLGSVNIEDTNYVFINHEISGSSDIQAFSVERAEDAGEASDGTSAITQPKLEPTDEVIEGTINGGRITVATFDEDYNVIGARNLIEIVRVADTGATNAVRNTVPVGGPAPGGFGIGLVFGEYALNPETGDYEFSHVENGSPNTYSNDAGEEVNILGVYSGTDAADGTRLTWGELLDPTDGIGDGTNGEFATTLNFDAFSQMHLVDDGFRRRNGNVTPYVMTGEASEDGIAYFHIGNGTTVPINGFGSFNYGQIYSASEYRQAQDGTDRGTTVLLATDNSEDGEVYMYLAPQVPGNVGGFADTEESLYVLEAQGDLAVGETTSAAWVLVDGNPITNVKDVDDLDGDGDTDELIPTAGASTLDLIFLSSFAISDVDGLALDNDGNLVASITGVSGFDPGLTAGVKTAIITPDLTSSDWTVTVESDFLDIIDGFESQTPAALGQGINGFDYLPNGNLLASGGLGGLIAELSLDPDTGELTPVEGGINFTGEDFLFVGGSYQTLGGVVYDDTDDTIYTIVHAGAEPFTADVGTPVIRQFETDGTLIQTWELLDTIPGIDPEGIEIDPTTGNFFILDDAGSLFTGADGGSSIHEVTLNDDGTVELVSTTNLGDGIFADPEGLALDAENRILYVSFDNDSPVPDGVEVGNQIVAYQLADTDATGINTLNSDALSDWVNDNNSTNFVNPTDIAESPITPGTFYFVAEGDAGYGELYQLTLDPSGTIPGITNSGEPPAIAADLTFLLAGTADESFDNLTVDSNGQVIVQGDGGTFLFNGSGLTLLSDTAGTGIVEATGNEFGYLSSVDDEIVFTAQSTVPGPDPVEETVRGTSVDDSFIVADGGEFDGNNDTVFTFSGNDIVDATGGFGGNRISTGSGNDTIYVSSDDKAFGGSGDDTFFTTEGSGNTLSGGAGNDEFYLSSGDRVLGGSGDDTFFGADGSNNRVSGGSGDDTFFIGSGDSVFGGAGADAYWITSGELPTEASTVGGFELGVDVIGVIGFTFNDLEFAGNTISIEGVEVANVVGVNTASLDQSNFVFG